MPKDLIEVAQEVRAAFMPAETSTDMAAARVARCLAVLVEARMKGRLRPMIGVEAIERVTRATTKLTEGRAELMAAHEMLSSITKDLGIAHAFGDDDKVGNTPTGRITVAA